MILKVCENKIENVCAVVPSTSCKIVGYAECELIQEDTASRRRNV